MNQKLDYHNIKMKLDFKSYKKNIKSNVLIPTSKYNNMKKVRKLLTKNLKKDRRRD